MCSMIEIFRCGILIFMSIGFMIYYYFAEDQLTTTTLITTARYTIPPPETEEDVTKRARPLTPIVCPHHNNTRGRNVYFCYLNSHAVKRWKRNAKFTMPNLPICLCTHLIYGFAGVSGNGEITGLVGASFWNYRNNFLDFMDMKLRYPKINLMLSIGGENKKNIYNFTKVIKDINLRLNFVKSIMAVLRKFNLIGIDFYYPDPTADGATKTNFNTFMKQLRAKFGTQYLLTVFCVPFAEDSAPNIDVLQLNKYIDYFLFMTYDIYTAANSNTTGANSLYYHHQNPRNLDNITKIWLNKGAFRNKTLLGVSLHANSFKLIDEAYNVPGTAHNGFGERGPYATSRFWWTYLEVCETLLNDTTLWTIREVYNYAYTYFSYTWLSFENTQSAYAKGRYAALNDYPGVFFYTIDQDDFGGFCEVNYCKVCENHKYPILHSTIKGFESFNYHEIITSL